MKKYAIVLLSFLIFFACQARSDPATSTFSQDTEIQADQPSNQLITDHMSVDQVKAKFSVNALTQFGNHPDYPSQEVKMNAVADDSSKGENNSFAQATPFADLKMTVDNPAVMGFFKPGRDYYVTFQEVPEELQTYPKT